ICQHLTPLEVLSAVLAAVCHDLDHPGVNQPFLIATHNHLATLYQNHSVLENHHWRCAMSCLWSSGVLQHWEYDDVTILQDNIRSLILATDITRQYEFISRFTHYLDTSTLNTQDATHRHFTLQIAIKCADICNPCRPWLVSRKWSYKICDEFYRQGDNERQLNLPVTTLCDRYVTSVAKIQTGFIKFVVSPLFHTWHRWLNTTLSTNMITNMKNNLETWQKELEAEENERKLEIEKEEERLEVEGGEKERRMEGEEEERLEGEEEEERLEGEEEERLEGEEKERRMEGEEEERLEGEEKERRMEGEEEERLEGEGEEERLEGEEGERLEGEKKKERLEGEGEAKERLEGEEEERLEVVEEGEKERKMEGEKEKVECGIRTEGECGREEECGTGKNGTGKVEERNVEEQKSNLEEEKVEERNVEEQKSNVEEEKVEKRNVEEQKGNVEQEKVEERNVE
ncbi:hypothetical protein Pcinc_017486, partial [Petrolisthes cinctipes]